MDKRQNRQLNMYLAVLRFCQENAAIIALNPALRKAVDRLKPEA